MTKAEHAQIYFTSQEQIQFEKDYFHGEKIRTNTTERIVRAIKPLDTYYHEDFIDNNSRHFNVFNTPVIYGIYGHYGHADSALARYALEPLSPNLIFAAAADHWNKNIVRQKLRYITVASYDVNRNNQSGSKNNHVTAFRILNAGFSLGLFVEGGREEDPSKPLLDREIKEGVAYLAVKYSRYLQELGLESIPLIPVLMHNNQFIMNKKSKLPNIRPKKRPVIFVDKPIHIDLKNLNKHDNRAAKELTPTLIERFQYYDDMCNLLR